LEGVAPELVYTPNSGFHGTDSFTYLVNDGTQDSNVAQVTFRVNPPPSDPTGVIVSSTTIPTTTVDGSQVAVLQAEDPNFNETHVFELVAGEGDTHNARFTIEGNQLIARSDFSSEAGQIFSVRVRVTDSSGRSHERALVFQGVNATSDVVINEIFYDPPGNARTEFVELHNPTSGSVDLSGWSFTSGISYTFPAGSEIPPGGYAVVAMDPAAFLQ